MVVGQAEQAQGQDRVRHGGIDAAEAPRHRRPLLEPGARGGDGALAERPRGEALPDLQAVVDGDEEGLPEQAAPAEGLRHARKAQARLLARDGPQLVQRQVRRQPRDRLAIHDDQQGHDDAARPVGHLVDVEEEERRRQQHDLDRHGRDRAPRHLPVQREQNARKDI